MHIFNDFANILKLWSKFFLITIGLSNTVVIVSMVTESQKTQLNTASKQTLDTVYVNLDQVNI